MGITASGREFREFETFQRTLLRWALRAKCDTRSSMLYLVSKSASAQLLCHKACWRFFGGLERHRRTATDIVH